MPIGRLGPLFFNLFNRLREIATRNRWQLWAANGIIRAAGGQPVW
jgi:hypothetical protein